MGGTGQGAEAREPVSLLHERCVGAGQCVLTAPAIFTQDDAGIVSLVQSALGADQLAAARAAAGFCPSRAIRVAGAGPG